MTRGTTPGSTDTGSPPKPPATETGPVAAAARRDGDRAVVDAFGTGFQHTRVSRAGGGAYLWSRSAGPDRPTPLHAPTEAARALLASTGAAGRGCPIRLCLPAAALGALEYTTTGSVTVAKLLWQLVPGELRERMTTVLYGTGALLRELHQCVPPPGTALTKPASGRPTQENPGGRLRWDAPHGLSAAPGRVAPTGPARLAAWLDSGEGPRGATRLHYVLRRRLTGSQWDAVRSWCADLAWQGGDAVLLHGAPSTGSLVLGSGAELLCGEDLAQGPAGFDPGWLLGEFLELRMTAAAHGTPADPLLRELPEALLAGYGTTPDSMWMGRAAVLRLLTHAHDFAAYVGWHPELTVYAAAAPGYIDIEGRAALDGTV
ncbi:hypothetical protein AB0A77_17490 [Streptomyces varsoviensis]|uniref:hypothetical protein n=1 Tax=Streptomyces varsoviensis TaxID=67373 RepID=UPI0033C789AE